MIVKDLINEPGRFCFANVDASGMTIQWCSYGENKPMEGLAIQIPRNKMLELGYAIEKARKEIEKEQESCKNCMWEDDENLCPYEGKVFMPEFVTSCSDFKLDKNKLRRNKIED